MDIASTQAAIDYHIQQRKELGMENIRRATPMDGTGQPFSTNHPVDLLNSQEDSILNRKTDSDSHDDKATSLNVHAPKDRRVQEHHLSHRQTSRPSQFMSPPPHKNKMNTKQIHDALLVKGWTVEALHQYIRTELVKKKESDCLVSYNTRVNSDYSNSRAKVKYMPIVAAHSPSVESTSRMACNTERATDGHGNHARAFYEENITNAHIQRPRELIKLINIDSRFRNNVGTSQSNDFVIDLNYTLRNVTRMRLQEIEIPNSWSHTVGGQAQQQPHSSGLRPGPTNRKTI